MKLTKGHKGQFVRDIMRDIPQIDYYAQIREYMQAEAVKLMPPEVRALYDNVETRCYLTCVSVTVSGYYRDVGSIFWRRVDSDAVSGTRSLYPVRRNFNGALDAPTQRLLDIVGAKVKELSGKSVEQNNARDSMEQKLHAMLAGIRTLKQAKTLLEPELHKYLPAEPPKGDAKAAQASTALVPYVVANLREMGWPKDQEPKAEEVV